MVTQAIHDDHEPVGQSKPRKGKSKERANSTSKGRARTTQRQSKVKAW